MDDILSAEELAQYLNVNYRTILQMARHGRLPGRRVGTAWRFHKEAIDQWLAAAEYQTRMARPHSPQPADQHQLVLDQ